MSLQESPILTIIMPTYNVEKYIIKSIRSILSQDSQEYRLIIIDDKSTDNTLSIIQATFKQEIENKKIELINLEINSGAAKARQIGLDMTTTPYVTFFDSDDSYKSNHAISTMIETIKKYHTDFIMFKYITDHGMIKLKKNYSLPSKKILSSREAMIDKVNKANPIWHYLWNKCYKTSIIKDHNIRFHTNLRMAEDVRFNDDFLIHSHNLVFINRYLYLYNCCNSSSISHSNKTSGNIDNIIMRWNSECKNYERLMNNCRLLECDKECKESLTANLCMSAINITQTYKESPWYTEIKNLIHQSPYYRDMQTIYPTLKRKIQREKKIRYIKILIKKILKV